MMLPPVNGFDLERNGPVTQLIDHELSFNDVNVNNVVHWPENGSRITMHLSRLKLVFIELVTSL